MELRQEGNGPQAIAHTSPITVHYDNAAQYNHRHDALSVKLAIQLTVSATAIIACCLLGLWAVVEEMRLDIQRHTKERYYTSERHADQLRHIEEKIDILLRNMD